MEKDCIKVVETKNIQQPAKGRCGLACHLSGVCTTVSAVAQATGGINPESFIQPDVN